MSNVSSDALSSSVQLPRSVTLKFRLETTSGEKSNINFGRFDPFVSKFCMLYSLVSVSSH
jgi:hypothetical protein